MDIKQIVREAVLPFGIDPGFKAKEQKLRVAVETPKAEVGKKKSPLELRIAKIAAGR